MCWDGPLRGGEHQRRLREEALLQSLRGWGQAPLQCGPPGIMLSVGWQCLKCECDIKEVSSGLKKALLSWWEEKSRISRCVVGGEQTSCHQNVQDGLSSHVAETQAMALVDWPCFPLCSCLLAFCSRRNSLVFLPQEGGWRRTWVMRGLLSLRAGGCSSNNLENNYLCCSLWF